MAKYKGNDDETREVIFPDYLEENAGVMNWSRDEIRDLIARACALRAVKVPKIRFHSSYYKQGAIHGVFFKNAYEIVIAGSRNPVTALHEVAHIDHMGHQKDWGNCMTALLRRFGPEIVQRWMNADKPEPATHVRKAKDEIWFLWNDGLTAREISEEMGIRYQHAYNYTSKWDKLKATYIKLGYTPFWKTSDSKSLKSILRRF